TKSKGATIARTTWNIVYRDHGNFGGDTPPREAAPKIPKDKAPDFKIEEQTSPEQALLYRLSGDLNPLHADPEFAKGVGFDQGPILHGLCTYGYATRHLAKGLCGGDASKIVGIDGSFKRPVWPGETLITEGWTIEPGVVALQTSVKERSEVVLGGAWAKLA